MTKHLPAIFGVFLLQCATSAIGQQADPVGSEWTRTRLAWQTDPVFQTPETVLYDAGRDVLYVSNFRVVEPPARGPHPERAEFLSKLDVSGKIVKMKWVTGLKRPTGMAIFRDSLYVVERDNLIRIDRDKARIEQRIPIRGAGFPNDIVFDADGVGFISDTGKNAQHSIHRLKDGKISPWLPSKQVARPNGLLMEGEDLITYDSRRKALIRIDCRTQTANVIAKLASDARAVGDGLVQLDEQRYLVTAWGGPSWVVRKDGRVSPLLDTRSLTPAKSKQVNNADSGFVPDKKLWIIPTFSDGRLLAYEFY